ncbi:hypothetical protein GOBAR_DD24212 [Gossypium barbadense]|nr:hypothetical protein GOBAR_DD24212 [Gossypium barbadense]
MGKFEGRYQQRQPELTPENLIKALLLSFLQVRKEKLGDRITALHQLVSPFGKSWRLRVLGDEICYRAKDYLSIHKLFATRADLYRTVYTHSKVKVQRRSNSYMILLQMVRMELMWILDDTIIKTIETAPDEELRESRDLILHIRRRNLY